MSLVESETEVCSGLTQPTTAHPSAFERRHFVEKSRSTIGSGPVDPPTLAGHPCPEQAFHRRATCVVIQRSSALVKAACVPRFGKTEALAVEMMAKLVAKSAEEGAE